MVCCVCIFFLMKRRPPRSTRTDTHLPYTTLCRSYDVPGRLASCHTAVIGGSAIEGHVPMRHVARLLQEKPRDVRSEEQPSEFQSLMRILYAVFCLKKKNRNAHQHEPHHYSTQAATHTAAIMHHDDP